MLATAFDPLAAAHDLKAAGFEPEQAEALAAQLRFAVGADLATKAGIEALKGDIAGLRVEFGTVRWAVGLIAAFLFVIGLRVFGLI